MSSWAEFYLKVLGKQIVIDAIINAIFHAVWASEIGLEHETRHGPRPHIARPVLVTAHVVSDGKQPGCEFSVDADACPGVYQLQEEILESVLGRFQITQHLLEIVEGAH